MNLLNGIKSIIILKKIFSNLTKNKYFTIIQHNKNMQKKFGLQFLDYINLYKLTPKIGIELSISKDYFIRHNFINIGGNSSSFHIYFDNKTEETDQICINNVNEFKKVKKIKILIDDKIKSLRELFYNRVNIEEINFIKFKRNDIDDMRSLFEGCSSLK